LVLTMLLGGLWHGANWTFIVWGLWHGSLLALEKYFNVDNQSTAFNFVKWSTTLFLVMLGWVVFRSENMGQALVMYQAMFSFDQFSLSPDFSQDILSYHYFMLAFAWGMIIVIGNLPRIKKIVLDINSVLTRYFYLPSKGFDNHMINSVYVIKSGIVFIAFVFSILLLIENSFSPFLYFQF